MASSQDTAAQFKRLRTWQAEHGGEMFPTLASLEWFIRTHRVELIQSGDYLPRPGRGGALLSPTFGQKAVEILQRQAREVA